MMKKHPTQSQDTFKRERGSKIATNTTQVEPSTDNIQRPPSQTSISKKEPSPPYSPEAKKGPKTRIVVKYDVGFNNSLHIRGAGASLSWEKGIPLTNVRSDEWIWESNKPFTSCEFKVLINDQQYEIGENHLLTYGTTIQYTPTFS
jgi:hypothetical protein